MNPNEYFGIKVGDLVKVNIRDPRFEIGLVVKVLYNKDGSRGGWFEVLCLNKIQMVHYSLAEVINEQGKS